MDISQLALDEPDVIDYENYDEGGSNGASGFSLPPTVDENGENIIFTLQVGEDIKYTKAVSSGKLMATVDTMTVQGPVGADAQVRFSRFSSKQFSRNGQPINKSQMGDFLKSGGVNVPKGATNQVMADACDALRGRSIRAVLDWVAYDKATQTEYRGYTNFPLSDSGDGTRWPGLKPGSTFLQTYKGTTEKKSVENPLRANLTIRWLVPATA